MLEFKNNILAEKMYKRPVQKDNFPFRYDVKVEKDSYRDAWTVKFSAIFDIRSICKEEEIEACKNLAKRTFMIKTYGDILNELIEIRKEFYENIGPQHFYNGNISFKIDELIKKLERKINEPYRQD